ncbi:MAG: NifU family protein [Bacteroidetes bacterium]|nr:MAG: NifU family protein [Bacteroidota bacterium]MBL1143876.1 NifU family protein [Bacteroidota bacterium]MCB0801514.1 NifU family protein [Flavobacteriales bacterium]NOG56677.1 NifU family protein [Bacteroidota bacterium]
MEVLNKEELTSKIEEAIQQLRPFLEADGGDIQLVDVVDNVARVKLLGACKSCNMSAMTLKAGVEESIKRVAPQIKSVVAI